MVYVCRNPKDACVSFHKFCQIRTPEFTGDFTGFAPLFKKGTMIYGSYWYHLRVSARDIRAPITEVSILVHFLFLIEWMGEKESQEPEVHLV